MRELPAGLQHGGSIKRELLDIEIKGPINLSVSESDDKYESAIARTMIKIRGKNRKSNKNTNLNLEQDNEPGKITGMAAELAGESTVLAEELAESTGEKLKAKLATRPRGRRNTTTC